MPLLVAADLQILQWRVAGWAGGDQQNVGVRSSPRLKPPNIHAFAFGLGVFSKEKSAMRDHSVGKGEDSKLDLEVVHA